MANETMTLISTTTVGAGGTNSISLQSIPLALVPKLLPRLFRRAIIEAKAASIAATILLISSAKACSCDFSPSIKALETPSPRL